MQTINISRQIIIVSVMDFNFNKAPLLYLHAVRMTLQRSFIVARLKVPQLDGGILRCGDHVGKYRVEDDPAMMDH